MQEFTQIHFDVGLLSADLVVIWLWKKNQSIQKIFVRTTEQGIHFTQNHMCHLLCLPGKQSKSNLLRRLSLSSHQNKMIQLFNILQSFLDDSINPTFYILQIGCVRLCKLIILEVIYCVLYILFFKFLKPNFYFVVCFSRLI